ncbi:HAMP domain-containing histidine kinase [bacterium]|nr:HAMP domain-containing histidine kinase [bacterium]
MDKKVTRHFHYKTTFLGILLSLGSPLGYILLTYLFYSEGISFFPWIKHLYTDHLFTLFYVTVPTSIVFALFGLTLGLTAKKLWIQKQSMDQLLHVVAHDIRSPLTTIQMSLAALKDPNINKNEDAHIHDIIERQVGIIKNLSEEILELERLESGIFTLDIKPSIIGDLLQKTLEEMELLLKQKKLKVILDPSIDSSFKLKVDAFKIRQVLRNLLSNAVKNTLEKGIIFFSVIESTAGLTIECHNKGQQIPPNKLTIIFDKFTQANKSDQKKGYGLGLAICKEIMGAHHGTIYAQNKTDGVSFYLFFPKTALELYK